jgi:signal transduction histidine kinase
MSAQPGQATLPLRRWLLLALVIAFVVPVTITGSVAAAFVRQPNDGVNLAVERLRAGSAQWDDPSWQAATKAELARSGVDFILYQDGREIYRSVADPLAATDAAQPSNHGWWGSADTARLSRELTIPGTSPTRTAHIYAPVNPVNTHRAWILPIIGVTTLLATLSAIGWVLGRMVVRPLAATSAAAGRVAAGDLDIVLPQSRVREVAEVNTAFKAMSDGLRVAVEERAALEQERRLFIGAVAHDLRTPLFAMRGYLAGLAEGLADTPEKAARYVAVTQEKAEALERLVADLFDFTRLEYLDQAPSREPLDLRRLLQRLVEGVRPQADAKQVQMVLEMPDEPCIADIDSHLLTRAIENLLDNALRHTPSGGTVRVACARDPNGIRFSVADTGPGIPAADLPNLFRPLYRGETSRNRRTGGAGLGLTTARRVLLAHGGDLTAENGPNGGALFRGTLPAASG